MFMPSYKYVPYKMCSRLDWIFDAHFIIIYGFHSELFLRTVILLSFISLHTHQCHFLLYFAHFIVTIIRVGCEHACRIIFKLLVEHSFKIMQHSWHEIYAILWSWLCLSCSGLALSTMRQASRAARGCVCVALPHRKALNNYISCNF